MEIKINNKQYVLAHNFKSMWYFERLTDKVFSIVKVSDMLLYLYAMLAANNDDFSMDLNAFMTWCDQDQEELARSMSFLSGNLEKSSHWFDNSNESDNKKKAPLE